jgi:hypothetical protein
MTIDLNDKHNDSLFEYHSHFAIPMQLATKYNIIFFSWPVAAAFLLLFTFISGPGSKIWLVLVETEVYGTIKIGALGICAGDQ